VVAILGHPYEVVLDVEDGVGATAVVGHGQRGVASSEASFSVKLPRAAGNVLKLFA
jgi:hypothetical protein